MSRARPIIVKLGGSLVEEETAADMLAVIVKARRPVILVPGGGAFADTVRAEQARWRIDDASAHAMALLAMHQTALLLAALSSRLSVCDSGASIARACAEGRVPVWAPARMALADDAMPHDWSITSDGLAAWLALRLRARQVVLLKSRLAAPSLGPAELARQGIVDAVFAELVRETALPFALIGPGEGARLAALLDAGEPALTIHPRPGVAAHG